MRQWTINGVAVSLELGHEDDSDLDLVLKTESIPLGLTPGGVIGSGGTIGGFGISVTEASSANVILHWPAISFEDPDRRSAIYEAARNALEEAERLELKRVGLFTLGLEVSRIPSWEVANEMTRAVVEHLKDQTNLQAVAFVAGSAMQVSSLEFALSNQWTFSSDG